MGPFNPQLSATISPGTGAGTRADLTPPAGEQPGRECYFYNAGPEKCFLRAGDPTVQATADDMCVAPEAYGVLSIGKATHVSGRTASGSTTLHLTRGWGQ